MALFNFKCNKCLAVCRRISVREPNIQCGKCQLPMTRDNNPPNTQVKEVLDNGSMPKRIERLRDAEELYKNRKKD